MGKCLVFACEAMELILNGLQTLLSLVSLSDGTKAKTIP